MALRVDLGVLHIRRLLGAKADALQTLANRPMMTLVV